MISHRIKLPRSKYYFDIYLFKTSEEMLKYLREVERYQNDHPIDALCWRSASGNKLARLYFYEEMVNEIVVEHELIHVIFQYMRFRYYHNKNYDPYQNEYEEGLAYLYSDIKAQTKLALGLYGSKYDTEEIFYMARETYLYNRKRYKWDDVAKKKRGKKSRA